jgi:hypothetical protein
MGLSAYRYWHFREKSKNLDPWIEVLIDIDIMTKKNMLLIASGLATRKRNGRGRRQKETFYSLSFVFDTFGSGPCRIGEVCMP